MWCVHMNFRPKIAVLLSSHILRNHAHGCSQCWSLTCLIPEGLCVLSLCLCLKIYFSGIKMSSPLKKKILHVSQLRFSPNQDVSYSDNSTQLSFDVFNCDGGVSHRNNILCCKKTQPKKLCVTKQVTKVWTYLFWVIYTGLIRTQRTQFN